MSILINGVDVPKSCGKCFVGNREICVNGCPLIPVPPHGRMIEEAAAIEITWMILRGLGYLKGENPQLEQTVRKVFATVPAIEVE